MTVDDYLQLPSLADMVWAKEADGRSSLVMGGLNVLRKSLGTASRSIGRYLHPGNIRKPLFVPGKNPPPTTPTNPTPPLFQQEKNVVEAMTPSLTVRNEPSPGISGSGSIGRGAYAYERPAGPIQQGNLPVYPRQMPRYRSQITFPETPETSRIDELMSRPETLGQKLRYGIKQIRRQAPYQAARAIRAATTAANNARNNIGLRQIARPAAGVGIPLAVNAALPQDQAADWASQGLQYVGMDPESAQRLADTGAILGYGAMNTLAPAWGLGPAVGGLFRRAPLAVQRGAQWGLPALYAGYEAQNPSVGRMFSGTIDNLSGGALSNFNETQRQAQQAAQSVQKLTDRGNKVLDAVEPSANWFGQLTKDPFGAIQQGWNGLNDTQKAGLGLSLLAMAAPAFSSRGGAGSWAGGLGAAGTLGLLSMYYPQLAKMWGMSQNPLGDLLAAKEETPVATAQGPAAGPTAAQPVPDQVSQQTPAP